MALTELGVILVLCRIGGVLLCKEDGMDGLVEPGGEVSLQGVEVDLLP